MANPRQRRKQRSGTKTVRSSRRQQDRLKKVDPRGPASFVAAWDKTKTPRQNWKALGLLSGKLDPRASGGAEHTLTKEEYWAIKQGKMADFELPDEASDEEMDTAADAAATEDPEEEDEEEDEGEDSAPQASTSTAPTTVSSALGKGEGRIIRDASGKVIQIILGGDDSATEQTVTASTGLPKLEDKGKAKDVTPWGAPMEELDNIKDRSIEDAGPAKRKTDERLAAPQGIAYAAKRSLVEPKTALVVGESRKTHQYFETQPV